jgi:pimeloyl-ACP methyl ester carboxylesterase
MNIRNLPVILLPILLLGCVSDNASEFSSDISMAGVRDNKIDSFEDVTINGCIEKISVQSDDVKNNPVLLYLHGGPGSSVFMYSHLYNEKLKKEFIFVNWDQRGTAFSYHEGMTRNISEDAIRDDALELTRYLTKRFKKQKIYLLGHSFGSVIGLQLAANHPEYFYAYIGVGQVIDTKYDESVKITYKWLHETLVKANDHADLERIEKDHFPYIDIVTKYGGHHNLSIDLDSLKKTSPYYFEGYLDLAKKSQAYTLDCMAENPNLKSIFNKRLSKIAVPLYFFEGVNDHVIACAPELVVEYCKTVKAPGAKVIWFENSAHMINIEEPEKFQDELIKIKKGLSDNQGGKEAVNDEPDR